MWYLLLFISVIHKCNLIFTRNIIIYIYWAIYMIYWGRRTHYHVSALSSQITCGNASYILIRLGRGWMTNWEVIVWFSFYFNFNYFFVFCICARNLFICLLIVSDKCLRAINILYTYILKYLICQTQHDLGPRPQNINWMYI